jgi:hypothetical protein
MNKLRILALVLIVLCIALIVYSIRYVEVNNEDTKNLIKCHSICENYTSMNYINKMCYCYKDNKITYQENMGE